MSLKILVDGKNFETEEKELKNIVEEVQTYAQENSMVVSFLVINGERTYTDLEELFREKIEEIKEIEFKTTSYHDLCVNTLNEMLKYLSKLESGYEEIVELVENNKISEAMNILNYAIEGIEWMNNAFGNILKIWKIELDSTEQKFLADYSNHLGELVSALENQDYITIKDVISFDLKEDLREWKIIIEKYLREGQNIH